MKTFRARLQKRIWATVFVAALCACFCGLILGCGEKEPSRAVFTVYAPDVDVVYDGRAHFVVVLNTIDGDVVSYFDEQTLEWVDVSPSFIYPGTYTVRFKVERPVEGGFENYTGSATVVIRRAILDGISAEPATFVYDGAPHNIAVDGTQSSDVITYSLDGESFSPSLGVTEPGEYTVFYRVTGEYGDYASSCPLTILPDICGRYLDPERGVIELFRELAAIGSEELLLVYGVDGSGTIGGKPFAVEGETLSYNGGAYLRIGKSDCVYMLDLNGKGVYFAAARESSANVRFEQNKAVVSVGGRDIAELENVNYCDTTGEYKSFTLELAAQGGVTVVSLGFSLLAEQEIEPIAVSVVYDGSAHAFDIEYGGRVRFETGGEYTDISPSFTDVGTHAVNVLYLRDGYLPFESVATMYVLPDICGVYYSSDAVAVLSSDGATVNGVAVSLASDKAEWIMDGKRISIEPDGITVGGAKYKKRVDESLLLIKTSTETVVVKHSERDLSFSATATGDNEIAFEICGHDGQTVYSSVHTCTRLTVKVDGQDRFTATEEASGSGIIGSTEIIMTAVIIFELIAFN